MTEASASVCLLLATALKTTFGFHRQQKSYYVRDRSENGVFRNWLSVCIVFWYFFCVCLCTVVLLTQACILSPNKTDYHYGNSIKKKFNSMVSLLKTRLSTFYQLFSNGRMKISHCYCQHRLKCTIIFKSLSAGEKLQVNTKNTLSAIWWIQLTELST